MVKKFFIGIVTALVVAGAFVLVMQEDKPKKVVIDKKNIVKKTVNMSGMTCEACEIAIEKVSKDTGVVKVTASSPDQKAVVEFDKTQTDIHTIMKAIELKGFKPVSYEDEEGLHELAPSKTEEPKSEMKCGSGKCGTGKCGGE
ncbi:cation transporter [Campylobacterota bacterium]